MTSLVGFNLVKLPSSIVQSYLLLSCCIFMSQPALATFSIIACENSTKTCAAAVATNNLAVGASVIYVQAGVGAVTTQFETNPHYGPQGLKMLKQGKSPDETLKCLLKGDNNFDGGGVDDRQVALVGLNGNPATYNGANAKRSAWSGSMTGTNYSVQGNGLDSEKVLQAMQRVFLTATGTLAEKVMAALLAGQNAGGQKIGSFSAALMAKTLEGFPHDIDMRVDASKEPVKDLKRLLDMHYARQLIIAAERTARQKKFEQSLIFNQQALEKGATWDRIWRRAARLAIKLNDTERAIEYLRIFQSLNPVWFAIETKQPIYDVLRYEPGFIAISH